MGSHNPQLNSAIESASVVDVELQNSHNVVFVLAIEEQGHLLEVLAGSGIMSDAMKSWRGASKTSQGGSCCTTYYRSI